MDSWMESDDLKRMSQHIWDYLNEAKIIETRVNALCNIVVTIIEKFQNFPYSGSLAVRESNAIHLFFSFNK